MFQKLVVNIVEKLDSLIENKKSIIELDIEDLKEKIQTLKTNQLFYVFDDQTPKDSLSVEQFDTYSVHAAEVPKILTPYITTDLKSGNLKVNVDPLMSNYRFITIDPSSGQIIDHIRN